MGSGVLRVARGKRRGFRIFLKTKKADQKHCENWQRGCGSSSEFHKAASPMCERGEWRKQLRDSITQSLKQTPLGSGTISNLFWPNGSRVVNVNVRFPSATRVQSYEPLVQFLRHF